VQELDGESMKQYIYKL